MPGLRKDFDDEEGPPVVTPVSSRRKGLRRLAITSGDGSADSMPGLQTVSNTEDDDDDDDDDDEDEDDDYGDEDRDVDDPDSFYDAENEDEIREMVDEAKFVAREGDFYDAGNNIPSEIDPFLQEDRKGNPFLKLLGSLRGSSFAILSSIRVFSYLISTGRMFSSSPKLKTTTTRTEPRRGAFRATSSGVPKTVPTTTPPKPKPQEPSTTPSGE